MEKEILFEYLLAAVLIIIPLVLIYLEFADYKKRKSKKEPQENNEYIKRLKKIKVKEPSTALDDIDVIARDYFKELFNIKNFPGYSALQKEFERQNKKNESLFCKIMDEFLYEENKPKKKHIKKLIDVFERIIIKNLEEKENSENNQQQKAKKSKEKKDSKKQKSEE